MTEEVAQTELEEQEQAVRCNRMIIALHLRSLIEKSTDEYMLVPPALVDQIKELRAHDLVQGNLDFGVYTYSIIAEYLLTHFFGLYMGYEWNADDVHPEVYIILERATAA